MFIFSNKDKVSELLIEATKFLLKHIYTKWMNGLKIISVNKNLMKTNPMFF